MMAKVKNNADLELAITDAVRSLGPAKSGTFGKIMSDPKVNKELQKAVKEEPETEVFRLLDRRLQALRKRGVIRFAGQLEGWVIA